jgi:hypothetical protein
MAILFTGLLLCSAFRPGGPNTSEFIDFIRQFDVSPIWLEDQVISKAGHDTVSRPISMGQFGKQGTMMETHFINVFKDPQNSYQYMVYGKMKIASTIVNFNGTLTIEEARLYDETLAAQFKQGFVKGHFDFRIPDGPYAGDMSGHYESFFIWGSNYKIHYDALNLGSEDYVNNIFQGKWVSSGKIKTVSDFQFQDAVAREQPNQNNNTTILKTDKWWE